VRRTGDCSVFGRRFKGRRRESDEDLQRTQAAAATALQSATGGTVTARSPQPTLLEVLANGGEVWQIFEAMAQPFGCQARLRISFVEQLATVSVLLACASTSPLRDSESKPLHDSCLHSCQNVRQIPVCPKEIASAPAHSPGQVAAMAAGQPVRVRGRLGKGRGNWTQIECPRDVCCSEQLEPYVSLQDGTGELALAGEFRLPGDYSDKLRCAAREGRMVQTYAASLRSSWGFTSWNRRRDGDPDPETLQDDAYCCSLDAREQDVIVEGTVEPSGGPFSLHKLVDPFICELARRGR
jgi:hypothetical protein